MADAPALRISTLSTASIGTSAARSTKLAPSSVGAADSTCRLPFKSTSVDATPNPRRLMLAVPAVKFWVRLSELFSAPMLIASMPAKSRRSLAARFLSWSASNSTRRDGAPAGRLMRLPVRATTTTSSKSWAAAPRSRESATAGAARATERTAAHMPAPRLLAIEFGWRRNILAPSGERGPYQNRRRRSGRGASGSAGVSPALRAKGPRFPIRWRRITGTQPAYPASVWVMPRSSNAPTRGAPGSA